MTQSALSPERLTMLYRLVNDYMVLQCLPNTNYAAAFSMAWTAKSSPALFPAERLAHTERIGHGY
jgi:hypothetical protein